MRTWKQAEEAGKAVGFRLLDSRDVAEASAAAVKPWYMRLGGNVKLFRWCARGGLGFAGWGWRYMGGWAHWHACMPAHLPAAAAAAAAACPPWCCKAAGVARPRLTAPPARPARPSPRCQDRRGQRRDRERDGVPAHRAARHGRRAQDAVRHGRCGTEEEACVQQLLPGPVVQCVAEVVGWPCFAPQACIRPRCRGANRPGRRAAALAAQPTPQPPAPAPCPAGTMPQCPSWRAASRASSRPCTCWSSRCPPQAGPAWLECQCWLWQQAAWAAAVQRRQRRARAGTASVP